ncbi:MAG: PilZ domain-containing protein [Gemmataceae bacterium]
MPTTSSTGSASNRRSATRYLPAYGTICRLDPIGGKGDPAIGLVCNVSTTGVSMLMSEEPVAGSKRTGELALESGDVKISLVFKLIHVRTVPTGDYIVGAQFHRELTHDEIQQFLTIPDQHAYRVESGIFEALKIPKNS